MTYLFISDLHLSPDHPRLVRGFLDLLKHYQDKNTQLYILGDWFNAWVGDDDPSEWLKELVEHLKVFSQAGNQIFFIEGNRDFALGQTFLDQFNALKMNDVSFVHINDIYIGIEHGDLLCTDDTSYQRFRHFIRHPLVLKILLATPVKFRQMLANDFRKKSKQSKQEKSYDIMDVNEDAVARSLSTLDILIHGHTHRPAIHHFYNKKRVVLGDWRESEAKILEIDPSNPTKLELKTWSY